MLVRQPISRMTRIALGCSSVLLLIGMYTWLSESRQATKRGDAASRLESLQTERQSFEQSLVDGGTTADRTKLSRMDQQIESLGDEVENAVDRSIPTWTSLYRDGLLRVLRPQGLKKDQYWLVEDAWASAVRLFGGLLVGVLLSVVIGVLMGAYTPIEAFFVPPLSFLAKIPPTAMLAVFFVLVGTTFKMYVTMIAFGTLPTLAQTVFQSARKDVPETLVFKAYTLGASHGELIWNVMYKQILPRLIDAVRLQIGPAMVLLVAAEWMVAGEGIGYRLRLFYLRTDMTVVYLYLLLLGASGLFIDYALGWFRQWLCPWFGE